MPPSQLSWLHMVVPNTSYSYQVQATNTFASSDLSPPVLFRTAMPIPPFTPTLESTAVALPYYPTVRTSAHCTAHLPVRPPLRIAVACHCPPFGRSRLTYVADVRAPPALDEHRPRSE